MYSVIFILTLINTLSGIILFNIKKQNEQIILFLVMLIFFILFNNLVKTLTLWNLKKAIHIFFRKLFEMQEKSIDFKRISIEWQST